MINNKPFKTYDQQVEILKGHGLNIDSVENAKQDLKDVILFSN